MRNNFDVIIIGAGSGGLVVASVAAQLGYKVALFEKHKMGGDCLNYGCVPSKSLIASAKRAHLAKSSALFGIDMQAKVAFTRVMEHVQNVIKSIEPHDSVERFEKLGVRVFLCEAKFLSKNSIIAGDKIFTAKKFVVATGSRAFIPDIKGISEVKFYTNETIFSLKTKPKHLVIIGGGPIACEMAQSFSRLGSKVTILQSASQILHRDEPDNVEVVEKALQADGVEIITNANISSVEGKKEIKLEYEVDSKKHKLKASHLLIAAGRRANLDLDLEKAKVAFTDSGIVVRPNMQTTNKHIYAVGDCVGPYLFTHMASYQASICIARMLFGNIFAKVSYNAVPWVTYTDPEIAQVGMSKYEAQEKYTDKLLVHSFAYEDNDRARAERRTEGKVQILALKNGRVVGANIVGLNAGELIHEWAIIIQNGLKLGKIATTIHAYPTLAEINKRVAGEFYKKLLFSKRTKSVSKYLFKLTGWF